MGGWGGYLFPQELLDHPARDGDRTLPGRCVVERCCGRSLPCPVFACSSEELPESHIRTLARLQNILTPDCAPLAQSLPPLQSAPSPLSGCWKSSHTVPTLAFRRGACPSRRDAHGMDTERQATGGVLGSQHQAEWFGYSRAEGVGTEITRPLRPQKGPRNS